MDTLLIYIELNTCDVINVNHDCSQSVPSISQWGNELWLIFRNDAI